jgi:hypothetical protein
MILKVRRDSKRRWRSFMYRRVDCGASAPKHAFCTLVRRSASINAGDGLLTMLSKQHCRQTKSIADIRQGAANLIWCGIDD